MTVILLFMAALGTPLSWHKTFLSDRNTWLSFLINVPICSVQVSMEKLPAVRNVLLQIALGKAHHFKTIEEWAGIINWAAIAYSVLRPFRFHVYEWLKSAKHRPYTQPGHALKILASTMITVLDGPARPYPTVYRRGKVWAATDAAAYEAGHQRLPCVGGWWSVGPPDKSAVKWFSVSIPRHQKWAFKEGSSQRRVAAVELMATVLLCKLMMQDGVVGRGNVATPLVTDNAGNSLGISKERFKKWPAADILMGLALTCHFADAHFTVSHIKRDQNEWADQLSKEVTGDFSPALRCDWSWDDDSVWQLWPTLRDQGYASREL